MEREPITDPRLPPLGYTALQLSPPSLSLTFVAVFQLVLEGPLRLVPDEVEQCGPVPHALVPRPVPQPHGGGIDRVLLQVHERGVPQPLEQLLVVTQVVPSGAQQFWQRE